MTRKTIRQALVTLFDADSTFNQVLGYLPLDLNGATKVLCVYSIGTANEFLSGHLNNDFYTFRLDGFIRRTGAEADENDMDDMSEAARTVIRANISNANWNELDLSQESTYLQTEISGVPYIVERHLLKVKLARSS